MAFVKITTQIGCKNSCSYCPQEKFIKAYRERSDIFSLNFDAFKACIDKIPKYVVVHFAGMCEPWQNPECTKMILYTYKNGHKTRVDTTLVGVREEDVALLEAIHFDHFAVHLPSKDGYETINVDERYLRLLNKISKSKIKIRYHFHGTAVNPVVESILKGRDIKNGRLVTRAGNLAADYITPAQKKEGPLACLRKLRNNILLPNGDVILCCMDWGLQNVLGNLLVSDYKSLFKSSVFCRIKKELRLRNSDIICRYCNYAFPYAPLSVRIQRNILNIRSFGDFPGLATKIYRKMTDWAG